MLDATHYQQVAYDRYRSDPVHNPMPAPEDHGARWVLTFWPHRDPIWCPDDDQVSTEVRQVRVNHGRWVVDCPCGGAQFPCRTDHRVFCVDCQGAASDGKWASVEWPEDPEAVEAALSVRPTSLQNWNPGETLAELQAENALLTVQGRVA